MSVTLIGVLFCLPLVARAAFAEESDCAQFEKSLDCCEIEYDVRLRCEKGLLIMGGDVISTSHGSKTLLEHVKFNDDFEYRIENCGKNRFRILCKKKAPRGIWGSMKEVLDYKKQKIVSPYLSKKTDQARYLVTRGESETTSGQEPGKKSPGNQIFVLIPEIPFSLKNTSDGPCEIEIVDGAGEKKIGQRVASGETFQAIPEKIGLEVGKEYRLNRTSGDVVESVDVVFVKDENTAAIASVLSEIDADSTFTREEKRNIKVAFLNRVIALHDQYRLLWLVEFLESQD